MNTPANPILKSGSSLQGQSNIAWCATKIYEYKLLWFRYFMLLHTINFQMYNLSMYVAKTRTLIRFAVTASWSATLFSYMQKVGFLIMRLILFLYNSVLFHILIMYLDSKPRVVVPIDIKTPFVGDCYKEKIIEPQHEKTNVLVSDLVQHKSGCAATEDG